MRCLKSVGRHKILDFKSKRIRIIHMFLNAIMSFTHGKAYSDLLPSIKEHSRYLFVWSFLYFFMLTIFSTIFPTYIAFELIILFIGLGFFIVIYYYTDKHIGKILFESILSGKFGEYRKRYKNMEDWLLLIVIGTSFAIITTFFASIIYFLRTPVSNLVSEIEALNLISNIILKVSDFIPSIFIFPIFLFLLLIFIPILYVWRLRINYGTKNKDMSFLSRIFVGLSLLMFTLTRLIFLIFVFITKLIARSDNVWCRAIIITPDALQNIDFRMQRKFGLKLTNIYSLPQPFESIFGSRHNRCGFISHKNKRFFLSTGLGELYIYGDDKDKTDELREYLNKQLL